MDDIYIALLTGLTVSIPQIMGLVLACYSKNLLGKNWLIFSILLSLLTGYLFSTIPLLTNYQEKFFLLSGPLLAFSSISFTCFILANWASTRINIGVKDILFSFTGRIPRSVFWISLMMLLSFSAIVGHFSLQIIFNSTGLLNIVAWLLLISSSLLIIWISFATFAKRWHDVNKTGLFSFVLIAPLPGALYLIAVQGFVRGTFDENQYGESPLLLEQ